MEKNSKITLNPFLHRSPGAEISHAQKSLWEFPLNGIKWEKTRSTPCLDNFFSMVNPCLAKQEQEVPVGKAERPSSTTGNKDFS